MKTNINKFFNDIQLHNFYENAFNALIKYYNNELDIIQICDTILYNINSMEQFKKLCVQSLLDIKIRHYKFKPSQKFYVTNIICAGKFVNRNNHNILFTLYDNHSIHYFYYSEIPFYLYNT